MREITSYWFDVLSEITSYWFDVQKRANFQQLFCATCRFPQLFDLRAVCRGNKTLKYLNDFLLSIVKYNNNYTIEKL